MDRIRSQRFSDIEDNRLGALWTRKAIDLLTANLGILDGPGQEELTRQQNNLPVFEGALHTLSAQETSALNALGCNPSPLSQQDCAVYRPLVETRYSIYKQGLIADIQQWQEEIAELEAILRQYGFDASTQTQLYVRQSKKAAGQQTLGSLDGTKRGELGPWLC
jgi:hypothetical protein